MKYKIENLEFEKDENFDTVEINYDVHYTDPEDVIIPNFLRFENLINFINQSDEELKKQLDLLYSSLYGYGPKEIDFLRLIEEESNINLKYWIKKYFENDNNTEDFFEKHKEYCKKPIPPKKLNKIVEDLGSSYNSLGILEKKFREGYNEIDKAITEIALKHYPELLESDAETLKQLKGLFGDEAYSALIKVEDLLGYRLTIKKDLMKT